MLRRFVLGWLIVMTAAPALAVTVRGKVTTTLGAPLPGARVQLISLSGGPRNAADTITGVDGSYELLTDGAGRFLLLTSPSMNAPQFAPQIGYQFYGGRNDVLTMDVVLDSGEITPQVSALMGLETPLRQLADAPVQVRADELLTQAAVAPELRPVAGDFVVQLGQVGTPAALFVRGAPVEKTVVDGVSAEALGGGFNLAALTTAGLAAIASTPAVEVARGANPLFGVDADAGVMALTTERASTMHPVAVYTGDWGNLSTERNDLELSVVHSRSDALVEFARFDTDNDLPAARMHLVTEAANLGYRISGNTGVRLTLRDDIDAAPMASPYGFYGVAPKTRAAEQNLYGGFTFETKTAGGWHNLVRYGMVRERAQAFVYSMPATGVLVTIKGANGATAAGTATFLPEPAREDAVTNRDEVAWQSDLRVKAWLNVVGTARYQDERGADLTASQQDRLGRGHFSFATALSGEVKHRFFYEASGLFDHSAETGTNGGQRLGVTYAPVRPGTRKFRGTSLHATAAAGERELGVVETAQLGAAASPRSRTFDFEVEQTILPKTMSLRAGYFQGQYSHQVETLGLAPLRLGDALAYRAQGLEAEWRYNPGPRLLISGGYTYLAALVEISGAAATANPNLPGVAIGATTALVGARPFNRPPNTGFAAAEYTGTKFAASLKGAFAGTSDGTTGLVLNPALLLPNRNLSPGYGSVDASFSYSVTHFCTVFTQFTNLLDSRNLAPIGYLSTPFGVRVGVRVRLGRE